MRQSIESACHLKCEEPNVDATRFPVEDFDFTEDVEGRYLIHLFERTACLKNCYAGKRGINGRFSTKKIGSRTVIFDLLSIRIYWYTDDCQDTRFRLGSRSLKI